MSDHVPAGDTKTETAGAFEELTWRGVVYDATPDAARALAAGKVTCYNGFDPTAKSLHVGNLVPIMGLVRMQRHGHTPIALVGGGTGMIGDPSGRNDERHLLSTEAIEENVAGIRAQLERFLDFGAVSNRAALVNNADWLLKLNLLEFLRDTGKHFTVNYMLAKESVRARLDREAGISYTEFSYMLVQAYDFLHLYRQHGCTFQMGGSDQWGNILAGVELIRRVHGPRPSAGGGQSRAHAVVYPLITTGSGEKFGKSVGDAPTLDPNQTSPYRLYQFFLNTDDRDVVKYLKLFTLMSRTEIQGLGHAVETGPAGREAQRALAREVTERVHGSSGLAQAERVTSALFGSELCVLSADELLDVFEGAPGSELARSELDGGGIQAASLFARQRASASVGEARRLIAQGGLYVNGARVKDPAQAVTRSDLIDGRLLVLRQGAKTYHLVRVID